MRTEHWLYTIPLRLRSLFRRSQTDQELADELRDHIEEKTEEYVTSGMAAQEARRTALLEMGGVEKCKEECRDTRRVTWLQDLAQDIRFGLRMLRKSPGFTAVAVLTLALGIGANTAIFSLINSLLLRALPVANPSNLVLFSDSPVGGSDSGDQTGRWIFFSNDDYNYFRQHDPSFAELCAFQTGWNNAKVRLEGVPRAEMAPGRLVSGNFFSSLGLPAAAGRLFVPSDDKPGASPAVVLSYRYWMREFQGKRSVIGETFQVNETDFAIIGVAPPKFDDIKYDEPDFWIPLVFQPEVMSTESYANDPKMYWLNMMGRLKPGVTLAQAQTVANAELKEILKTQARPESAKKIANSYIKMAPGAWGISYYRATYMKALQILAAIIGVVLLIACANIANLLLSRSAGREQEIAVRLAVGASRGRLVRQFLTETLLLAFLGGILGILVAKWGAELLASVVLNVSSANIPMNMRVPAFAVGITLLAGILFGLAPALRCSRADLATHIKGSAPKRMRFGFANGLVIFQVAASLVLLVGAGLFLRTLHKLAEQQLGFDEDHILSVRIDAEAAGYLPVDTPALYQSLIDRVEAIPGVVSATVDNAEPFSGSTWTSNFSIEGEPVGNWRALTVHKELVGPHYFETQGIPILLGRDIGPQDRMGTPLVTVINETMAREYFHGVNPIGRRFSLGSPFNAKEAMTIVGVAADARYYSLREPIPPMEFCAAFQVPEPNSHNAAYAQNLEVRARGNPEAIATEIRPALKQVSSTLPVASINVLAREVQRSIQQNRGYAELSSAFGMLALFLACIGVYGTMAYRVSRRTHEIGVRMALGAQRADVLRLITGECLMLVGIGVLVGVPLALASTRVIASQLFEVRPSDPLTFAAVTALLVLVALAACYIPARRAMRVDPMVALRYE